MPRNTHRPAALRRVRIGSAAAITALALAAGVPAARSAGAGSPEAKPERPQRKVKVIVMHRGDAALAHSTIGALGGEVSRELSIIDGVAAEVPESAVARLQHAVGIKAVAPDLAMQATGGTYNPVTDMGSPQNLASITGAREYWKAGFTGRGVGVAVIDSGVAPVADMAVNLVRGPDLSFEGRFRAFRQMDTFGHGTHMAGIIAGRGRNAVPGTYATDTTNFLGMAPDAKIVSVKVADLNGAVDVSQVIAAIDWVVRHRNDRGLNIRVINLSYGTNASNDYTVDPLVYAAERAWKNGIFVVAATGNSGFADKKTGAMVSPAYSPNLFAVGATDANDTLAKKDDTVATFSSVGNTHRRPDLTAPGTSIVSLRVRGSWIDTRFGSTGRVSDTLFRGSGTSQAAAVVSGAAALVIQQRPDITPDQLKKVFQMSALAMQNSKKEEQGAGQLDLAKTLKTSTPGNEDWKNTWSTGSGSLDGSRGTEYLESDGVPLTGDQDIFGIPVAPTPEASPTPTPEAAPLPGETTDDLSGRTWTGRTWTGDEWTGEDWLGRTWTATDWSGRTWTAEEWYARTWTGDDWEARTWTNEEWVGGAWTASEWVSTSWTGAVWASAGWS